MRFYLGTDSPGWLWDRPPEHPLFISRRRLERYKTLKPAQQDWSLDSGGFTELNLYGEWRLTPQQYVARVRRYYDEIGRLDWAAPQDYMCEPFVLEKTGKTVTEHQRLTVENYLDLRTLSPELPFIPVLQGWQPDDYLRHTQMYESAGISLADEPLVGLGTFCRRADLTPVQNLVTRLYDDGLRMHGFGVKKDGLPVLGNYLASADSLAWSARARWAKSNLCGTQHRAKTCTHCRVWANEWANRMVSASSTSWLQLELFNA